MCVSRPYENGHFLDKKYLKYLTTALRQDLVTPPPQKKNGAGGRLAPIMGIMHQKNKKKSERKENEKEKAKREKLIKYNARKWRKSFSILDSYKHSETIFTREPKNSALPVGDFVTRRSAA